MQPLPDNVLNPLYLPTLDELKKAFPLEASYPTDSVEYPWLSPLFTSTQFKLNNYQVYTKEFIHTLGDYLLQKNLPVLEVGAGDGRLTYFLKEYVGSALEIVATDRKDWEEIGKTNQSQDVETLGYIEALEKYATKPTLVLSCWMNVDVNWTADFRKNLNVQEYILIGDVFRTGGYGQEYYLPPDSGFFCKKLSRNIDGTRNGIVKGSLGRFDGSPHNPESRTEVYSFIRQ
jgi:hypothetical protein